MSPSHVLSVVTNTTLHTVQDFDLSAVMAGADSHAKTVVRALESAHEYLGKPSTTAALALRDLDRAQTYLDKLQGQDDDGVAVDLLRQVYEHLRTLATERQERETTQRVLTQVERYRRYTLEALDKKNVPEAKRQWTQWKRYVEQLPDNAAARSDQEAALETAMAKVAMLESATQHASTVRQLERQIKSTRDTVMRAGSSMTAKSSEPYLAKCRDVLEKLPDELQDMYRPELTELESMVTSPPANNYNNNQPPIGSTTAAPSSSPSKTTTTTADSAVVDLNPNKRRSAERSIRIARGNLDQGEAERAHQQLERLVQMMDREGWPAAHRQEFLTQITSMQTECEECMAQQQRDRLWKSIERHFDIMRDAVENSRPQGPVVEERVEHAIGAVQRLVENEQHLLSGEQLASLPPRIDRVRDNVAASMRKWRVQEAERFVQRYADLLKDKSDLNDRLHVEAYERNAREALERVPQTMADDRAALEERMADLKTRIEAAWHELDREELIRRVQEEFQSLHCGEFQVEPGPTYATWRTNGRLGLDEMFHSVEQAHKFLQSHEVENAVNGGAESAIVDMSKAAEKLIETASEGLVQIIQALTSDVDVQDRPESLLHELDFLTAGLSGFKGLPEKKGHCLALVEQVKEQINDNLHDKERAEEQAKQALLDTAKKVFDPCLEACMDKIVEVSEPAEIVESADSFKGQLIRLTNRQNRKGWDFEGDGHALILRLRGGTPLVADFDDRFAAQAREMAQKWDPNGYQGNFDDVIVELTGRVVAARPIQFNRNLNRWDYLPREDGIHGRIVAFRRGPQAAGILVDNVVTSLEA